MTIADARHGNPRDRPRSRVAAQRLAGRSPGRSSPATSRATPRSASPRKDGHRTCTRASSNDGDNAEPPPRSPALPRSRTLSDAVRGATCRTVFGLHWPPAARGKPPTVRYVDRADRRLCRPRDCADLVRVAPAQAQCDARSSRHNASASRDAPADGRGDPWTASCARTHAAPRCGCLSLGGDLARCVATPSPGCRIMPTSRPRNPCVATP